MASLPKSFLPALPGQTGTVDAKLNDVGPLSYIDRASVWRERERVEGRLKSLTGGQGSYSIAFPHYAPVPAATQQQLASQHKTVVLEDD